MASSILRLIITEMCELFGSKFEETNFENVTKEFVEHAEHCDLCLRWLSNSLVHFKSSDYAEYPDALAGLKVVKENEHRL